MTNGPFLQDALLNSSDGLENIPTGMDLADPYIGAVDEEAASAGEHSLVNDSHSHEKRENHEHVMGREFVGPTLGGTPTTCDPAHGPSTFGPTLSDVEENS